MNIKKAEEIMIPIDKYPHIFHYYTLKQAIQALGHVEFEIYGKKSLPRVVLVFNENEELVGNVRRRDILRGLEPESFKEWGTGRRKKIFELWGGSSEIPPEKIVFEIQQKMERQVCEVMQPIKATVEASDGLIKVIHELVENNISLVPVMKDKKVVGVVRTVEAMYELCQLLGIPT